jgi:hypothetical protein
VQDGEPVDDVSTEYLPADLEQDDTKDHRRRLRCGRMLDLNVVYVGHSGEDHGEQRETYRDATLKVLCWGRGTR